MTGVFAGIFYVVEIALLLIVLESLRDIRAEIEALKESKRLNLHEPTEDMEKT